MSVQSGIPVSGSSDNVANAPGVASLSALEEKVTYIAGFEITAGGATAAALVTVTVSGVRNGPLSYTFAAPAGVDVGAAPLIVNYDPPIPATGANVPIVVTLPALGAGNTNATVVARGFQS